MIKVYKLILVLSLILFMFSCDEKMQIEDDNDGTELLPIPEPTEDIVKIRFDKKVALLSNNQSKIVGFLQKRMENLSTKLDESAELVIIDETSASEILTNAESLGLLEALWFGNKAIVYINPAENALKLHCVLSGRKAESLSQDILESYSNLELFVARADGKNFMHEKFKSHYSYNVSNTDEDGNSSIIEETAEYTPSNYNWGQVAENLCEWLIDKSTSEQGRSMYFASRTQEGVEDIVYKETIYRSSFVVSHEVVSMFGHGTPPPTKTVYPTIRIKTAGGYNKNYDCDVYDVLLEETFPADSTFEENVVTKKKAAYKYKYTGGFYTGPIVKAKLTSKNYALNANNVDLLDPVPMQTAGSYNENHIPGNWSIGGSVTGSLSSSGLGGNLGFSVSHTFPTTTTTRVVEEMPVVYTVDDITAIWDYGNLYIEVYDYRWGLNATYNGLADIYKQRCSTSQAVAYKLNKSKQVKNEKICLDLSVCFKLSCEWANPWSFGGGQMNNSAINIKFEMPEVWRYFMDYTPYMYSSTADGDSDGWSNLEAILDDNVNYKAFKQENLEVGSTTEEGVEKNALIIWNSTIDSLIKQYNGTKTKDNYVVGLADVNGNHLNVGLQVDSLGVWSKVTLE